MAFYFRKGDYRLFLTSQRTALGISFLTLLVTITLMSNLLKRNFNIDYVVKYTSQGTPVSYKLTALWAGQLGSLLYAIFGNIDTEKNVISLKIMVNHLVRWVWIGGYLLLIGTLMAFWSSKLGV